MLPELILACSFYLSLIGCGTLGIFLKSFNEIRCVFIIMYKRWQCGLSFVLATCTQKAG